MVIRQDDGSAPCGRQSECRGDKKKGEGGAVLFGMYDSAVAVVAVAAAAICLLRGRTNDDGYYSAVTSPRSDVIPRCVGVSPFR